MANDGVRAYQIGNRALHLSLHNILHMLCVCVCVRVLQCGKGWYKQTPPYHCLLPCQVSPRCRNHWPRVSPESSWNYMWSRRREEVCVCLSCAGDGGLVLYVSNSVFHIHWLSGRLVLCCAYRKCRHSRINKQTAFKGTGKTAVLRIGYAVSKTLLNSLYTLRTLPLSSYK